PEVIGVVALPDGTVYAAATNAETPSIAAPPPPDSKAGGAPAGGKEDVPKGTVTVTTSAPRLAAAAREPSRDKGAELVIVSPDGFVEPGWVFTEETIYSIRL